MAFRIGDPVDGSPGAPASDRDEEITGERMNRKIRGGKAEVASGFEEGLRFVPLVGVTLRSKRGKVNPAVGPAGEEEAVAVAPGKLGMTVDFHSGGGTAIDLAQTVDRVKKVRRAVEGALVSRKQPAMMASDPGMEDPAVGIPGKLVITFPIGVEGEEVAVLVEGEVVMVAETMSNDLTLFSIRRDAEDRSLRGVADG